MRRRETRADDNARTERLLDHSDRAFAHDTADEVTNAFEDVVMEGLLTDRSTPVYPPAGHSFPRRG